MAKVIFKMFFEFFFSNIFFNNFFFGENFFIEFFWRKFFFSQNISVKIFFTIFPRISVAFDVYEIMYFAKFWSTEKKLLIFFAIFFLTMYVNTKFENVSFLKKVKFSLIVLLNFFTHY